MKHTLKIHEPNLAYHNIKHFSKKNLFEIFAICCLKNRNFFPMKCIQDFPHFFLSTIWKKDFCAVVWVHTCARHIYKINIQLRHGLQDFKIYTVVCNKIICNKMKCWICRFLFKNCLDLLLLSSDVQYLVSFFNINNMLFAYLAYSSLVVL